MKILLDENLPHDLRHFLAGHEVFTVAYLGWHGTQNGALMRRAAADGFECLLTSDTGFADQHNPDALPIAIVIVHAKTNALVDLIPLLPELLGILAEIKPLTLLHVGR